MSRLEEARRASARSRTRSTLPAAEALAAVVGGGRSLRPRRAGSQGPEQAAVGVVIGGGATSVLGPASPLRRSARSGDSAAGAARMNSNRPSATNNTNTRGRRGNHAGNPHDVIINTPNHNIRPRRSTINYREDSSDDSDTASTTSDETNNGENDDDDGGERLAPPPRRSTRARSTRGRLSQTQLSTTTNSTTAPAISSGRQASGKRRRPRSGFFHEDSNDDDSQDDEILTTDHETLPTPRRGRTASSVTRARELAALHTPERKRRKFTPTSATKGRTPASSRKSKLGLAHIGGAEEDAVEEKPKVLIPWQRLEFFIWIDIFKYASAERDRDAVNFLLMASRLCKDFAEPALAALYYNPPLLNRKMAHGLVALLSLDESKTMYKYRYKVRKLRIDVQEIASKLYKGLPLDWNALFANVPMLKSIDFFHEKDNAPFRSLEVSLRWKYDAGMWDFLNGGQIPGTDHAPVRLEAWRWNGRLMTPEMTLQSLRTIHETPSFSKLKKLCLQNFHVPSMPLNNWPAVVEQEDNEGFEKFLIGEFAHAIDGLPQLEYLSIESSTIANDYLLSLLPKSLKTLELVNCWEITADDFAEYLLTRAHKLEHLYLRHNQSLSLSFLTVLGTACPFLQTLSVDLKTYNHHEFYNDSDPSYDEVLGAEEVPQWPVSLRTLELQNMRKWSAEAAENLFHSLIKAAPDLQDLRIININAKLNIPIRQRSEMRDRWEARLKGVFLRKWEDPKPLFTLRPPESPTRKQLLPAFLTSSKIPPLASKRSRTDKWVAQSIEGQQDSNSASQSTRRSARIAALSTGPSSTGGTPSPARGISNSGFRRESRSMSLSAEELSLSPREANVAGEILYRHGWCEKVELQLDNQKLTEQTLTMEDFVDGGGDDDEDEDSEWDGMDRDDDYGYGGGGMLGDLTLQSLPTCLSIS
ncbi:hypothetical protein B0T20DRAFT_60924 [Sordaria brevicollis]|uniref:Uncharacterized protein n=1 Tax=Sordaria brevicollis TaxID=83679 RepID=A0AAE0U6V9_SORBR|nr:hypothetical protein B0T20DRAFT_60924 [Sordaria brevicollis]